MPSGPRPVIIPTCRIPHHQADAEEVAKTRRQGDRETRSGQPQTDSNLSALPLLLVSFVLQKPLAPIYALQQTTAPAGEPLTLAQAKQHLARRDPGRRLLHCRPRHRGPRICGEDVGTQACSRRVGRRHLGPLPALLPLGRPHRDRHGNRPARPADPVRRARRSPLEHANAIIRLPRSLLQSGKLDHLPRRHGRSAGRSTRAIYLVDVASDPGRVTPSFEQLWPFTPRLNLRCLHPLHCRATGPALRSPRSPCAPMRLLIIATGISTASWQPPGYPATHPRRRRQR